MTPAVSQSIIRGLPVRPQDRRAAVAGVVAIAILLVASRGLPAWLGWVRGTRTEAVARLEEARRAESLAQISRWLHDTLVARNARYLALAPTLLGGTTSAAAGATLASIVSGAAAESGVKVEAEQVRAVATNAAAPALGAGSRGHRSSEGASRSAFLRLRVQIDVVGDIRGLTRFLFALERGPIRLGVRDLTVSQPDPVGRPDRPEALRANITVDALAVAPRDSTSRAP